MTKTKEAISRRQIIELGAAGAAALVLPNACSSSTSGGAVDASADAPRKDATVKDAPTEAAAPCKPDFVDAGGGCAQSDQTAAVNILKASIDQEGTSYEFSDCRYADPACNDDRIILIHGTKTQGYVALQGACPNECCDRTMENGGPTYYAVCTISIESSFPAGFVCNVDAGAPPDAEAPPDGAVDAEAGPDAGVDSAADTGAEAATDADTDADSAPQMGQVYNDILLCTCCGSIFDATTGARIDGPSKFGLQKLDTCEADGWVFITIPKVS
jgi:nitrite reductase/ring-hydroxylating ferredoxin subunit